MCFLLLLYTATRAAKSAELNEAWNFRWPLRPDLVVAARRLLDRFDIALTAELRRVKRDQFILYVRPRQRGDRSLAEIGVDREIVVAGHATVEVEVAVDPLPRAGRDAEVGVDGEVIVAGHPSIQVGVAEVGV